MTDDHDDRKNMKNFPGAAWCKTHSWCKHTSSSCKGISNNPRRKTARCWGCGSTEHRLHECHEVEEIPHYHNCDEHGHETWNCKKPKDRRRISQGARKARETSTTSRPREPVVIHDEDKPSIKVSSSTGTLSDSAVDKLLTMLSDDMSFELSSCMKYCIIGGFDSEHHAQKVMNDMQKIGGIDIMKNGGPPTSKHPGTKTAGGTSRTTGKEHAAGMNKEETQRMNQLESDVTGLKTDMAQVKQQN